MTSQLIRLPDARLAFWHGDQVRDLSGLYPTLGAWLSASIGRVAAAISDLERLAESLPSVGQPDQVWAAPVDAQDVWAAGVTYARSREARQEEAVDGGDVYDRVYSAERPELFFKAHGRDVVGHGAQVGIRADASWSVPEPELAIVLNPALEVVGFTVGNDMSSRDIEGANPLYLPQAKVYEASCALGPGIVLNAATAWPQTTIRLTIERGGEIAYSGDIHTERLKRTLPELVAYLGRAMRFPYGVVLLTGTGIVPPVNFTLAAEDVVSITIDGIGTLTNTVKVI
ncbi:MAG: 2-hydroxyhepta-2,4-diene-1,7-dioate isomerase [Chloroflexi bacterium]|nr:2-hydroxyhepta-2,4-diene-1,7-dioate isomerase [Chloroflexota bacterium]